MRTITRDMIKKYHIKKLGYDFMGYTFKRPDDLSFHHLIIARKDSHDAGIGEGYLAWNGAIVNQRTSHDYLHIIEQIDREAFLEITKFMIMENQKGELDLNLLWEIRKVLLAFEALHWNQVKTDGKPFIRERYITNRIQM